MVKFGKNKFKALNKIAKAQKLATASPITPNKILKKKINADKKVSFQKEVLLKDSISNNNPLVKNVTAKEIILNDLSKKQENNLKKAKSSVPKPKVKSVEKHKKRQKTQLNDTKLLLSLMKKIK